MRVKFWKGGGRGVGAKPRNVKDINGRIKH